MTKTYKNGNTIVSISDDGTKVRYVPDNAPAMPVYPESIDMKISNRCEMGCAQCHEQSTATGKQANLKHPLLDSLHPYTERQQHPGTRQGFVCHDSLSGLDVVLVWHG